MSKKGRFLMMHTLKTKFFNKAFLITNIVLAIAVVFLANLGNIIGSFVDEAKSDFTIYVVNETDDARFGDESVKAHYEAFKEAGYFADTKYDIQALDISNEETYKAKVTDNDDVVMIISLNTEGLIVVNYYRNTKPTINVKQFVSLIHSSFHAMKEEMKTPTTPSGHFIKTDGLDEETAIMIRSIVPMVLGVPIFLFMIMAITFTGTEVVDEKSSKVIEIVLTNVKASEHLVSKIIAVTIGLFCQILLMLVYGIIGMVTSMFIGGAKSSATGGVDISISGIGELIRTILGDAAYARIIPTLVFLVVFLLVGLLIFSVLSGMFGSTSSSIQDFNKVLTPLMMVVMAGYMVNIIAGPMGEKASGVIRFCSYIPLVSFQIVPAAYFLGDIQLYEVFISLGLNIIVILLLLKMAFRIYKEALLNFSEENPFKVLFKSFKRSKLKK